jgi:hypothetical protein
MKTKTYTRQIVATLVLTLLAIRTANAQATPNALIDQALPAFVLIALVVLIFLATAAILTQKPQTPQEQEEDEELDALELMKNSVSEWENIDEFSRKGSVTLQQDGSEIYIEMFETNKKSLQEAIRKEEQRKAWRFVRLALIITLFVFGLIMLLFLLLLQG